LTDLGPDSDRLSAIGVAAPVLGRLLRPRLVGLFSTGESAAAGEHTHSSSNGASGGVEQLNSTPDRMPGHGALERTGLLGLLGLPAALPRTADGDSVNRTVPDDARAGLADGLGTPGSVLGVSGAELAAARGVLSARQAVMEAMPGRGPGRGENDARRAAMAAELALS